MRKKLLALLMVTLLCVGCLPIENQLFNISFDGHDDAYEFEETRYKPGQKVVVYFTAIGTDTDYKFFTNGVEIAAEYESEKGYKIEFEMPGNDVVISYKATNTMEPTNKEDGMMNPMMIVSLVIDGKWYTLSKEDNPTAIEFFNKVSSDGLEALTMADYGGFEKNTNLPWSLSTDLDTNMTVNPGDVVLYQGKTLVLIYGENTADYTKIGSIDLVSDEMDELKKELAKKKDIQVDVVVEYTE